MPALSHKPGRGPVRIPTAPGSAPRAASRSAGPRAEPLPASRTPNTPGRLAAARRAATPQRSGPPEQPGRAGSADPEAPRPHTLERRTHEATLPAVLLRAPPAGDRHIPEEPARTRNRRQPAAGAAPPSSQQLFPPPLSEPAGRCRPGQETAPVAPAARHDQPGAPASPVRQRRRTAPVSRGPEVGSMDWSPGSSAGRDGFRRSARGPAARRTC